MDTVRVGVEVGYTYGVSEEEARRAFDEILYRYTRVLQDLWMARSLPPDELITRLMLVSSYATLGVKPRGVIDFVVAGWRDGKLVAVVGFRAGVSFAGVEYRLPVEPPDVYPAMICRGNTCVGYGPLSLASGAVRFAKSTVGLFIRDAGTASIPTLWELYKRLLSGDTSVLETIDSVAVYDRRSGKVYILRREPHGTLVSEYPSGRSHSVPYSLEEAYRMMTRGMRSLYATA